ncbi:glycosyltransferase [Gemmata sp. JC717]|uniref:glycosyltransferase n=1 Tax=Gemmata algarum TaxID=2975278 RepID=UPI0021BB24DE|nr:glycosyltransferase [Gemmata algarum]MDY3554843.1 glycosyltransferase [Gemmata algarum]
MPTTPVVPDTDPREEARGPEHAPATESKPVLLFASYHAYLDHASGAALATRDLFEGLAARGWSCRVVCGPALDHGDGRDPAQVLAGHRLAYQRERCAPPGGGRYELFHFVLNGVPVTQYRPDGFDPRRPPTQAQGVPFLDVVSRACRQFRPDLVLTYGGQPVEPHLIARVRRRGAKVLFCLHNLDYRDPALLRAADAVWVPSGFARDAYRERLGVEAEAVPWPWDRTRAVSAGSTGEFVTFVNPVPAKGAAWVARIAAELSRRRPEIPFLVVESRGRAGGLNHLGFDLSGVHNLSGMHSTPRPAEFYARSRALLVPSLCEETFGRVAAEGLANGLPVLATRRGALPETLGGAGLLFDVPERYTAPERFAAVPTGDEVRGWVAAIERLWDDPAFRAGHRAAALDRARAWEPERVLPVAEAFLCRTAAGRHR